MIFNQISKFLRKSLEFLPICGNIEPADASVPPSPWQPYYASLDIDLDAPHPATVIPSQTPSALQWAELADGIPEKYLAIDYYRSHSPADAFSQLRLDPATSDLNDTQVWDMVAYIWRLHTTPNELLAGRTLYQANCAACHGEDGGGDGIFADELEAAGNASMQSMQGSHDMVMQRPANFTDPQQMLGASPALLHGKITRGGMGTGMPMWGAIFTEEQIWNMAAYLFTFQFAGMIP